MKKRIVDLMVYFIAIFLDTFGIALMIKTNFGATPFGIVTSNAALALPLTVGMFAFIYEIFYILIAGKIRKGRIKWELLIYSFLFAVFIDFQLFYIPDLSSSSLITKIAITLISIVLIDLAKSFFNITVFPKLSTVELIYAISETYKLQLDTVSRMINGFNVLLGILFSYIGGKPFNNLGIGTILAVILLGEVLKYTSPIIKKKYIQFTSTTS